MLLALYLPMVFILFNGSTFEISSGVYWVGVKDWNRRIFDALIPLPKGTSYNAYLVLGSGSCALIDTVNPGFEFELEGKIRSILDPKEIDYVIMNHAEPDHAGAIPHIMKIATNAKLITTVRGEKMAKIFYKVSEDRIKTVVDFEELKLGGKTLCFIDAPMLHWPETMFTYLKEDGILFSCDFFGSHLAQGIYSDEIEDVILHAKKYWGEIMMPFRNMAQKALEKINNLNIEIIAPSHGPIYRNPKNIVDAYWSWVLGETKCKVVVAYVSMWSSTENMAKFMAESLIKEGIEVVLYNILISDIGELIKDLVDSRAIVLGAPTVLGGAHPLAIYIAYLMKCLRPPLKYAVFLSSYGWGGIAVKNLMEILGYLKIDVVGSIEVNGPPTDVEFKQISKLSKILAEKIKANH